MSLRLQLAGNKFITAASKEVKDILSGEAALVAIGWICLWLLYPYLIVNALAPIGYGTEIRPPIFHPLPRWHLDYHLAVQLLCQLWLLIGYLVYRQKAPQRRAFWIIGFSIPFLVFTYDIGIYSCAVLYITGYNFYIPEYPPSDSGKVLSVYNYIYFERPMLIDMINENNPGDYLVLLRQNLATSTIIFSTFYTLGTMHDYLTTWSKDAKRAPPARQRPGLSAQQPAANKEKLTEQAPSSKPVKFDEQAPAAKHVNVTEREADLTEQVSATLPTGMTLPDYMDRIIAGTATDADIARHRNYHIDYQINAIVKLMVRFDYFVYIAGAKIAWAYMQIDKNAKTHQSYQEYMRWCKLIIEQGRIERRIYPNRRGR